MSALAVKHRYPHARRLLAAAVFLCVQAPADHGAEPTAQLASAKSQPWWLDHESPRSRVVEARDTAPRDAFVLDAFAVDELVARSVQTLTDEPTPERAWRAIIGAGERIVVLFDGHAHRLQKSADTLGRVLVRQLMDAGYDPANIALVNAPTGLALSLRTRPLERGWGQAIPVDGKLEQIPVYLDDADAVINVPSLAAQPIGGVSGSVQNAALSFVRHPARYYRDSGPASVAQVLMDERVSSKVRLNIVNALRIILDGGADAGTEQIVGYGGLLVGFDPVAVDTQALSVLLRERHHSGVEKPIVPVFLDAATELGLGRRQTDAIQRLPLTRGG